MQFNAFYCILINLMKLNAKCWIILKIIILLLTNNFSETKYFYLASQLSSCLYCKLVMSEVHHGIKDSDFYCLFDSNGNYIFILSRRINYKIQRKINNFFHWKYGSNQFENKKKKCCCRQINQLTSFFFCAASFPVFYFFK